MASRNDWGRLPGIIRRFHQDSGLSNEQIIRGTFFKLAGAIFDDTPVDEGITLANWYFTKGQPSRQYDESRRRTRRGEDDAEREVDRLGDILGETLYLTNNSPNILTLEFGGYVDAGGNPANGPRTQGGFSSQAPNGMVRQNVRRFRRILDEEAS